MGVGLQSFRRRFAPASRCVKDSRSEGGHELRLRAGSGPSILPCERQVAARSRHRPKPQQNDVDGDYKAIAPASSPATQSSSAVHATLTILKTGGWGPRS